MKHRIFILLLLVFYSCELHYSDSSPADDIDENKLLSLINKSRTEGHNCGDEFMPPVDKLVWANELEKFALAHSIDMNRNNFFSHTNLNGENPWERAEYLSGEIQLSGENIARGYSSEEEVIQAWLNKPEHCRNIMSPHHTCMGMGKSGEYWTQSFGILNK